MIFIDETYHYQVEQITMFNSIYSQWRLICCSSKENNRKKEKENEDEGEK
jgi:hypothetical protein